MLTNLTNRTLSASLTLSTFGTRSVALVVDGNMLQLRAKRNRHASFLHSGKFTPAGIYLAPIDPELIRIDGPEDIPGSPLGGGWLASGQSQPPSPWSSCPSPSGVRQAVRSDVVVRRRVVPVGPVAGQTASPRAAAATARAMATAARAHAPAKAGAAMKRPAAMGG